MLAYETYRFTFAPPLGVRLKEGLGLILPLGLSIQCNAVVTYPEA